MTGVYVKFMYVCDSLTCIHYKILSILHVSKIISNPQVALSSTSRQINFKLLYK